MAGSASTPLFAMPGPQHRVVNGDGVPVRVSGGPGRGGIGDDVPLARVEYGSDVIAGEKQLGHVRPRHRGLQIRRVVADDEQGAARDDRGRETAEQHVPARRGQVQVLGGDQVGAGRGGLPGRDVGVQPADALRGRGACLRGVRGGALQRDGGYVGGGDGPAVLSQPDGVGALPAADVQRRARGQAGGLGDEVTVGITAPQRGLGPVALVPERLVELFRHDGSSLSGSSLPCAGGPAACRPTSTCSRPASASRSPSLRYTRATSGPTSSTGGCASCSASRTWCSCQARRPSSTPGYRTGSAPPAPSPSNS